MQAEVLAIGSEITSGRTVNTNASYLARRLEELGIPCVRQAAVADQPALIIRQIRDALRRSDLVVTTGGLGPTFDDMTVDALAQAVGRPLVRFPNVARAIKAFCRRHGRRITALALRQAWLPQGAVALPNPLGTAPGLWLETRGAVLIALPGVPHEMQGIMTRGVIPRLRRQAGRSVIAGRTIRTVGLVELRIQQLIERLRIPSTVQIGLYPHLMAVDIRLTVTGASRGAADRLLTRVERRLRARLGEAVYAVGDQTLEEAAGQALVKRRATLALAESCTGGLIAEQLTDVPGSSRYFKLGTVVYHNRMKERVLGVSVRELHRHGAVSAPVAKAMAAGVRRVAGTTFGLAVTGIAGPTGATPTKPVGLVYLALADARRVDARQFVFRGDRLGIRRQESQMALDWIRRRAQRA